MGNFLTQLPRIHIEKIVTAQRDHVFQIATDYESLQNTLPQHFLSVRVRSTRENVSVIEEHLRLAGKELIMMTKHVINPPELHNVFVIGGDAKGSHISERYEIIPQGTKITVDADIKLKGAIRLAGFFGKKRIENSLGEILDELAKTVEG